MGTNRIEVRYLYLATVSRRYCYISLICQNSSKWTEKDACKVIPYRNSICRSELGVGLAWGGEGTKYFRINLARHCTCCNGFHDLSAAGNLLRSI